MSSVSKKGLKVPDEVATDGLPSDEVTLRLIENAARLAAGKGWVRNKTDAESIANEAMSKALSGFRTGDGSFAAYFRTIFRRDVGNASRSVIRIPRERRRDSWGVTKWHDLLMELYDRKPTVEEIAESSGWTLNRVRRALEVPDLECSSSTSETVEDGRLRYEPREPRRPPDQYLPHADLLRRVLEAGNDLPHRLRTWLQCIVNGLDDEEILRVTGWTHGNLRQAQFQARSRLKQALPSEWQGLLDRVQELKGCCDD